MNSSVTLLINPWHTKHGQHPPSTNLDLAVSLGESWPQSFHLADGSPLPGLPHCLLSVWAFACRRTSPDVPFQTNRKMLNKRCRERLPLSHVIPVLTADAATPSQATPPSDLGNTSVHRGLSTRPLPRAEATSPDVEVTAQSVGGFRRTIAHLASKRRQCLVHTVLPNEHRVQSGPRAATPTYKNTSRGHFPPGCLLSHACRSTPGPCRVSAPNHPLTSTARLLWRLALCSTAQAALNPRPPLELPAGWI